MTVTRDAEKKKGMSYTIPSGTPSNGVQKSLRRKEAIQPLIMRRQQKVATDPISEFIRHAGLSRRQAHPLLY